MTGAERVVRGPRRRIGRAAVASLIALAVLGSTGGPAAASGPERTFTYRVETRGEVHTDLRGFARDAGRILGDARGWTLGGSVAFEEVRRGGDFALILASPDAVARASGVCSSLYSCRVGDQVLINDSNWRQGTPSWRGDGGDLATYRPMVINHEVGHRLGFGHRNCGSRGQAAPVMQQQSKGLQGCRVNGWPTPVELREFGRRAGVPVHDWVFTDVLHGRVHSAAIHEAASAGVVLGRGDGTFRPGDHVTRGQLASFLARSLELPLRGVGSFFADVPRGHPHGPAIAALAEHGIVTGNEAGEYRPGSRVTRGQMATMLARGYDLAPGGRAGFTDVASDHVHVHAIRAVADAGVALGYVDGTFRPSDRVSRAQLASFLVRAEASLMSGLGPPGRRPPDSTTERGTRRMSVAGGRS